MPSKEVLDQVLKYDPDTGELRWRVRPVTLFEQGTSKKKPRSAEHACNQWNSRWAGQPAATRKTDGYQYVHFNHRTELVHRIAHKIMTGEDPIEIDHIDGNRSNNKWSNLRNGSRSDNFRNLGLRRNNKSGHHGVFFSKRQQRWVASIMLGTFDNKEDAIAARKQAEASLGFHPNHGRSAPLSVTPPVSSAGLYNSKSGVIGVTWDGKRKLWHVEIKRNKRTRFVGRFADKDEAVIARKQAEVEYVSRATAEED
jgi:hypothetical protein